MYKEYRCQVHIESGLDTGKGASAAEPFNWRSHIVTFSVSFVRQATLKVFNAFHNVVGLWVWDIYSLYSITHKSMDGFAWRQGSRQGLFFWRVE